MDDDVQALLAGPIAIGPPDVRGLFADEYVPGMSERSMVAIQHGKLRASGQLPKPVISMTQMMAAMNQAAAVVRNWFAELAKAVTEAMRTLEPLLRLLRHTHCRSCLGDLPTRADGRARPCRRCVAQR